MVADVHQPRLSISGVITRLNRLAWDNIYSIVQLEITASRGLRINSEVAVSKNYFIAVNTYLLKVKAFYSVIRMKLKMVMGDLPIAPIYFYNRNCFVHLAA
jgi:hypothetical protein